IGPLCDEILGATIGIGGCRLIRRDLAGPARTDDKLGIEWAPEFEVLAGGLSVPDHKLADLLRNLRPATARDLIMGPGNDDNVTVPAVAETLVKLVINGDEPVLADDGLGARDGVIEDRVEGADRNPAVETGQPAILLGLST